MRPFISGWANEKVAEARETPLVKMLLAVPPPVYMDVEMPPSFSVSQFRKFPYDQGEVGSCFANGGAQTFQIMTVADNSKGARWNAVELSRRMVWYGGRKLDGSLGSRDDGGTVTNAMAAMAAPSNGGFGLCPESDWPYKADHKWLDMTPPASVLDLASTNYVTALANLTLGEAVKKSIFFLHPPEIGIWWPEGWDTEGGTFFDSIGGGGYGHALVIIGWITYKGKLYWQIENSHGPIYKPLPPEVAATVPGYVPATPTATYDFWPSDSVLQEVMGKSDTECVAAAGIHGWRTSLGPDNFLIPDLSGTSFGPPEQTA